MQYRRYENVVNTFSGSSYDHKSDDEFSYEEYEDRESKFRDHGATGSRLFRRWFFNIIDLPNALANRLKDWLTVPPGSRGSTSDKSSGTNSIDPSEIRLTKYAESDEEHCEKYKNRRRRDDPRKSYRAPGARRPNHHVYHIYKQNEMEIQQTVGGQRNYSTSWLQRNGRFSSSPVLVLPRIDPDTGQPIFHPRTHCSRTSTERRTVTRRNENLRSENWKSEIWELQTNHCTHPRGDTSTIENFVEKRISEKSQSSLKSKKNCSSKVNGTDDRELDLKSVELNVTGSTAFRETISMRLNLEDSQSFARTSNNEILDKKNSNKIKMKKIQERNSVDFQDNPKLFALTRNNVDDLLQNLREKVNSLNVEKKIAVQRLSGLIDPETRSYAREHLFASRWQDKSGLFAKEIRPICAEARASFTERIQDIWIQEKTSNRWTVIRKQGNIFHDEHATIEDNENFYREKEINCDIFDENTKIRNNENFHEEKKINCEIVDKNKKIKNNEFFREQKEINCDIFNRNMKIEDNKDIREEKKIKCTESKRDVRETDEALVSSFSVSKNIEISMPTVCHVAVQYSIPEAEASTELHHSSVIPSRRNDDKSEMQIPQILEPFPVSNEIPVDTVQFPSVQVIQAYAQYRDKVAGDFASPSTFIAVETRAIDEGNDPFEESRLKNELPQKKLPRDIEAKSFKFPFKYPQQKRLGHRLAKLPKIRLRSSLRFSRNPFVRSKKLNLRCRFPTKIRMWLIDKFRSNETTSLSVDDRTNLHSTTSGKLGCMMNIFKCIEKKSEIDLSPEFFEDRSTNVGLATPTRRQKLRARSFADKKTETMFDDVKNCSDEKSATKFFDEIEVDIGTVEPVISDNCKIHSERSMTTLSVTTSNSTNIPLQLLGSTSDTTIVPSHNSQDDFKRRVVVSRNRTDTTTRKQENETLEKTDDSRTDLSPTDGNKKIGEKSKIFEFNDVFEMTADPECRMKKSIEKKSFERKSVKVDRARKRLRSKENSPINGRSRKDVKFDKSIGNKSHSLNIENRSSRKSVLDKIEISNSTNKSADTRNAYDLRSKSRESVIGIGVNEASRSESMRKIAETRDSKKIEKKLEKSKNRSSPSNTPADTAKKQQSRGSNTAGLCPASVSTSTSKKLRKRADSPMIPRKTDSLKRRSTAAGKPSLIPVGIENSKYLSPPRKIDDRETACIGKSKLPEVKNRTVANSSEKYRSSVKKVSRDDSSSSGKKISNHRVHFELENNSSRDESARARLKKIDGCKDLGENLIDRKIDDKRLVRKIKSSLENGMPLKRITIMDPCTVSRRSGVKYDGRVKSKVEKDAIDRPGESRSNTRNLTTLMEKTIPISRTDKELLNQKYPRGERSLSEQIPKLEDSFEKRHPDETKLSYRSRHSRETKNKNHSKDYTSSREREKFDETIVDFARIRERVVNEILEKTSRTSGTEDSDCANVLIKAINSSMELSDL